MQKFMEIDLLENLEKIMKKCPAHKRICFCGKNFHRFQGSYYYIFFKNIRYYPSLYWSKNMGPQGVIQL